MSRTEALLNEQQPGWDCEAEGFDPEARRLVIHLPLPPTDNHCHSTGPNGRFPKAEYKDWLSVSARRLRDLLGPWPADAEEWWGVEVWLWMGSRSDGPNHLKPLLDLLGGSYVPEKGERDPRSGNLLDRQKIQKTDRGLFLNDKRIRWATPHVRSFRCQEPRCVVVAYPVPAPTDEKAEAEAAERAEKERRAEQEREWQADTNRKIVAILASRSVGKTIPGPLMEQITAVHSVGAERVRKVWRAHREAETTGGRKRGTDE